MIKRYLVLTGILILASMLYSDNPFPAVSGFELDRYLGTWYEIARLDHSFERGLSNVTATYSMKDEKSVRVLNRGYLAEKERWKEANGTAKFAESSDIGRLKVTFFWPFYGGYNIMELDKQDYQYVLIAGDSHKYLWILSREAVLPESVLQSLLDRARAEGFPTNDLIFVDQAKNLK